MSSGNCTVAAIAAQGRTVHVNSVDLIRESQNVEMESGSGREFWPPYPPLTRVKNATCVGCHGDLKEGTACVVVGDKSGGLLQWDQTMLQREVVFENDVVDLRIRPTVRGKLITMPVYSRLSWSMFLVIIYLGYDGHTRSTMICKGASSNEIRVAVPPMG